MVDYASLEATSQRLINENGRPMTLVKTEQTYDPQTGTLVDTPQNFAVIGVFTDYTSNEITGTTVQRGDKKLLIASSDLTEDITNEFKVLDGIETWNVQQATEVKPGPISMIWKLQVRR